MLDANKKKRVFIILMVGLSRIYYGVHSPAQVAVGWLLGLVILVVAVRYDEAIRLAFTRLQLGGQAGVVLACGLAAWVVCYAAWSTGAGFEPPQAWVDAYREVTGEAMADPMQLGLYDRAGCGILAIGMGYLILVLISRVQRVTVTGARQRIANVVLGIFSNLIVLSALGTLAGSALSLLLLALHPLFCIYLPMLLTQRFLPAAGQSS